MQFRLPSVPYQPSAEGYWNPVTSTINWCEEDYYATLYSAEIVNSLTNLIFVCFAYKGISSCVRNGHDRIFLAAFISYLVIGLGSFLFHSTLTYSMQLLDELSMIYTASIQFYIIFSHGMTRRASGLTLLFIVSLAVFITLYYHYLKDPTFHQAMFSLMTAVVFVRSAYVMVKTLRPSRRETRPGPAAAVDSQEQARIDRRDVAILKTMWQIIACGLISVTTGYSIWLLDIHFCSTIRRWRREVGLPWGIVLEGHGWWHLFTGVAAYFNITWGLWLRYCLNGKQDEVQLVWPSLFTSLPVVERKNQLSSGPRSNEGLKKKN